MKELDEIILLLTGIGDHTNPELCSLALNNLQILKNSEMELRKKNLPSLELIDKIDGLIKEFYGERE